MSFVRTAAALALAALAALAAPRAAVAKEQHEGAPAKAADAAAAEAAKAPTASRHYVHQWIAMPSFAAPSLSGGTRQVASAKGRALVLVFLASWCEPCQELTPRVVELEKRFRRLHVDFVYVFAHDTREDAEGFMKEFGIEDGVLANHDALKAYHNPELPAIYVGDRRGWLATRKLSAREADVQELAGLLKYLTAY